MMDKDKNLVVLSGYIKTDLEFIANFNGTKVYKTELGVLRLSGKEDILPIFISNKDMFFSSITVGKYVKIKGSMRSSQYRDDNHIKRTRVYVQVQEVLNCMDELPDEWYDNDVVLEGVLFKEPILRKAKTDKTSDIAELVLELSKGYNKFIHIPVICWGMDAKYISSFNKGTKVRVTGRFQSRHIIRHVRGDDDSLESAMSYEVSASGVEVLENKED